MIATEELEQWQHTAAELEHELNEARNIIAKVREWRLNKGSLAELDAILSAKEKP